MTSFNPLHCGAVVASTRSIPIVGGTIVVSIPFIAGQWSLLKLIFHFYFAHYRFNPLHCGAVVASKKKAEEKEK